jgi:hypothetical protein
MNARCICICIAFCGLILAASTATAGFTHPHPHAHKAVAPDGAPWQPHVHKTVSPFETQLGEKRIHCELLGHNPLLPCPHHQLPTEEKRTCYLTNECGGGPFPAPTSRSGGDMPRFLVSVTLAEADVRIFMTVWNHAELYDPFHYHSLDRPPRAL